MAERILIVVAFAFLGGVLVGAALTHALVWPREARGAATQQIQVHYVEGATCFTSSEGGISCLR